jgi:hypothetical protein
MLISFGADVNLPSGGVTPFFNAVCRENLGLAAVMLTNGADINAAFGHWTVMAIAVHNDNLPMAELIMRWNPHWSSDLDFLVSVAISTESIDMLQLLTKDLDRETYDATPHIREAVYRGCSMVLDFFTPFKAIGPMQVVSTNRAAVTEWMETKKKESDMVMRMIRMVGLDIGRMIKSFLVPPWTLQYTGSAFIMPII